MFDYRTNQAQSFDWVRLPNSWIGNVRLENHQKYSVLHSKLLIQQSQSNRHQLMTTSQLTTTSPSSPTNLSLQSSSSRLLNKATDSRCVMLIWEVLSAHFGWWEPLRLFKQRFSQYFNILPYLDQRQYFCCFFHLKKDHVLYSRCLAGWLPRSSIQLCLSVVYFMKTTLVLSLISAPLNYHFAFTFIKAIFPWFERNIN